MFRLKFSIAAALAAFLSAASASAGLVTTLDDIELWAGSGSNRSALVIDWADGRDPLAWGYRWDGAATGEEMFMAILAADGRLTAKFNNFGSLEEPNLFVNTIGYDRDEDGLSKNDADDSFESSGNFVDDFRFWEYHTAPNSPYTDADGPGTWESSDVGISGRTLSDGAWDGFRFDAASPGPAPGQAVAAEVAAVPEPGAGLLVLLAAAGGFVARRRGVGRARRTA